MRRFEEAVTPKTRVLHVCHITNLTGQIFPVRDICRMARARGIQTIVDGAHAFAHFPFKLSDLECDYYGTSLHKWLLAPVGTGFLYVRRERIQELWPLTPAAEGKKNDIRKFEEIGTHPAAMHNAIAEALAVSTRRSARSAKWRDSDFSRIAGPNDWPGGRHQAAHELRSGTVRGPRERRPRPSSTAVRSPTICGTRHRIIVTPIKHAEYEGLRVTPNVYTTLQEVDTFASAIERILEKGLQPTAQG